jgi:RimJ/RimL family protein N-acetyltransferase
MDYRPETREQARGWLDGVATHGRVRSREGYNLAVVARESGRVIGWLGFGESSRYPPGSGEVGVGYALARAAWGNGYAPEAVRAAIDYGFGVLGARRLSAWCWAENRASARVMEKCGLRLGRRYERVEPKSGLPTPCEEYELRASDLGRLGATGVTGLLVEAEMRGRVEGALGRALREGETSVGLDRGRVVGLL